MALSLTLCLPLSLRPACRILHCRTGLQKADEQLISLMMNENEGRSSYVVVLTKCDKVNDKKVREGVGDRDRRRGTAAPLGVDVDVVFEFLLRYPCVVFYCSSIAAAQQNPQCIGDPGAYAQLSYRRV